MTRSSSTLCARAYAVAVDQEQSILAAENSYEALLPLVAVPVVELLGEPCDAFPYKFAAHQVIPGISVAEVTAERRNRTAAELGDDLSRLHLIPEAEARAGGVGELDKDEPGRIAWLQRAQEVCEQLRDTSPQLIQPSNGRRTFHGRFHCTTDPANSSTTIWGRSMSWSIRIREP